MTMAAGPMAPEASGHHIQALRGTCDELSRRFAALAAELSAAAERVKGWMWIRPSPWVWMPVTSVGPSCSTGTSVPHTLIANEACQWSEGCPSPRLARGETSFAPAPSFSARAKATMPAPRATMAITPA